MERKLRKNNIVVFGIDARNQSQNALKPILEILNATLECNLEQWDIHNYYKLGKSSSSSVVLEFISFRRKLLLYQISGNCNSLLSKITNCNCQNDLCQEDREAQKILRKHLREVRSQSLV